MQVKLTIQSDDLSMEELRALLEAARIALHQAFPGKTLHVWLDTVPQLTTEQNRSLLGGISPPFADVCVLDEKNVGRVVDLGPREMHFGGQHVAAVDNMVVTVAEATEEELEALRNARVVSLVRPGRG